MPVFIFTFVIMEKRLSQLLRALNLSAAQFADQIGVQRSSISHVISGRNKPSMDFTEKILRHFPQVNVEWLIMGNGSMLKGGDLFSAPVEKDALPSQVTDAIAERNVKEIISGQVPQRKAPQVLNAQGTQGATTGKLEKIVWFFSDGTFREYKNSAP
ncbi:MAG: helix-turn-helix transcriptional regulator [Bacteroidales bacterium]|nr:helix-turn-helix transcriptional regulator [Bacteroidales bacterium]